MSTLLIAKPVSPQSLIQCLSDSEIQLSKKFVAFKFKIPTMPFTQHDTEVVPLSVYGLPGEHWKSVPGGERQT